MQFKSEGCILYIGISLLEDGLQMQNYIHFVVRNFFTCLCCSKMESMNCLVANDFVFVYSIRCVVSALIIGASENVEMLLFPVLVEVSGRRAFAKVYLTDYR